jgi:hypothetical protein
VENLNSIERVRHHSPQSMCHTGFCSHSKIGLIEVITVTGRVYVVFTYYHGKILTL